MGGAEREAAPFEQIWRENPALRHVWDEGAGWQLRQRRAQSRSFRREAPLALACGGPSALSSDGPRGGSGAGRRQPAPGSPRRGGGEVPEALPRLLGGVSWWSVLPRGSSPSGPPPPPAVPLPGPQDPSARVRGAWGLRGFGNPGVARQGERPQLGLSQAAASSLGRAGSISRG